MRSMAQSLSRTNRGLHRIDLRRVDLACLRNRAKRSADWPGANRNSTVTGGGRHYGIGGTSGGERYGQAMMTIFLATGVSTCVGSGGTKYRTLTTSSLLPASSGVPTADARK